MSLQSLLPIFTASSRLKEIESLLSNKKVSRMAVKGLAGSSAAVLAASLKPAKKPYIFIANDADDAGYVYHDLCQLLDPSAIQILPSAYKRDIKYGHIDPPAQILRTATLEAFALKETRWIVTYPEALAEKVPQQDDLSESTLHLVAGKNADIEATVKKLLELGFFKTDYVYEPGQFARRGSILDVYSYANELPYRIDFFDDEIDSIRTFNVETQLSEERISAIDIVSSLHSPSASEGVSFTLFTGPCTAFCRDYGSLLARVHAITQESISASVIESGEGDTEAMNQVVDFEEFSASLSLFKIVEIASASSREYAPEIPAVDFQATPQGIYHKNFELISSSFHDLLKEGYKLYILSDSRQQTERLKAIFADRGDDIPFSAVLGTLHEGFVDHPSKCCFFTDHQIFDRFHKYTLRSEKARSGKLAFSLKELNSIEPGDYIVHIDHGIGRFGGLVRTNVSGKTQEMIKLIYAGDDIIFVSIHALHKLSKYRGKDGVPPKINKLGTGAWNRIKERTKTKLKEIARDLIKLYAARREEKGFAFSPDTYLQHELEAGFIYEDTPDQLAATKAVKADMEAPKPMDRLICGDVGFGKTEIAIRAAFKAAVDGKQTAVLVPTTVLAFQHYQTFSERLKELPVTVAFLSRAVKPKRVKEILADLAEGKIDIIIGTHKLIGKTVKFHDLGLLVIDEEQKFGVAVKEKLKQLKVNVDTLTMSATPIPRTLQFSLMGARDLSNLKTPPANRQPIITTVAVSSEDIIAEAVGFEISRGGQVFFICNRIERQGQIHNMLNRLVPGVKVVEAHGQMPPDKLEQAICDFSNRDYDVLLATTIVESGIDMPNVNTIIIDNAQNFGLSELHQLRGRVGRSSRKAFCYMLTPPTDLISQVARRRLQAIESFSDLGSGIHIAMQDLDIRGAGNLLGAEQSGFIADLGYEAYQKILKESVTELKTEEFADTFTDEAAGKQEEFTADCSIESDLELLIPPSYVPKESERIALYRELDNMETQADIDGFRARMLDRFGALPHITEELIRIVPLRAQAKQLGIEKLFLKQGKMFLYFVGEDNKAYYRSPAFGRVLTYMQQNPRTTRLRDKSGVRSMVIESVTTVESALAILRLIATLPAA